jgi:NAD(P)-dependent dehydrogenase (short-subunit alcohol dehydrogenase family)
VVTAAPVLVLTGTTGIAAAAARLAAQQGLRLAVVGRETESGEELAAELTGNGTECLFHAADLTIAAQVDAAVARCVERFGRVDLLFNVAGISGRRFGDGPVHACSEEGWDVTLDHNLKSTFLVCRAVLNRMLGQPAGENGQRGAIVAMASVLADAPESRYFATHAYAASKAAVIGLTRAMASYYAPHGIRVNAVAPALVRTPMSRRAQEDPEILELLRTKQPLAANLIEPEDVAGAALFLLGDGARAITGEILTVDAGWSVSG